MMFHRVAGFFFVYVMFLFFAATQGYANLSIHISQGVDKPYPIAIVPFEKSALGAGNEQKPMDQVITTDLVNSGRFSTLASTKMPDVPNGMKSFNWQEWNQADLGAEYVVIGDIKPESMQGRYTVSFELMSLLSNKPLLGKRFEHIKSEQFRSLGHHISDLIYQVVTGKRGYFSTKLAYVEVTGSRKDQRYQLVISDIDGENSAVLVQQKNRPILSPAWSPDGRHLVYVSYVNNRMAVYKIDVLTGYQKIIANYPGINSAPAWSPDGKNIALALSKGESARTDIYLMNVVNHRLTRLTSMGINTSPSFSPDGKDIVFTSNRGGRPQIYKIDIASKDVSRLTFEGVQNFSAHYTPNGKMLVMMQQNSAGGKIQIATLDLENGDMHAISHGRLDKSPSISPDGSMVIFANYDNLNGVLAAASINGKVQLKLPATQGSVQSPAWSPFFN